VNDLYGSMLVFFSLDYKGKKNVYEEFVVIITVHQTVHSLAT
jgi:hypothetical protein